MASEERRRHARIALGVDVDFKSDANFYTGRTRDVSAGGLFIETDVGLKEGSHVSVHLKLLDATFDIPAEVAWTLLGSAGETVGIGLRFLQLPGAARAKIEAFMGQRAPMSFEMLDSEHPRAEDASTGASPDRRRGKKPPPLPR